LIVSELHTAWGPASSTPLPDYVKRFTAKYVRAMDAFVSAQERWPGEVRLCSYEDFRDGGALSEVLT
jgi:hypothetical protein